YGRVVDEGVFRTGIPRLSCPPLKTAVIIFPFDLFGSAGTGQGAELLADALTEMLRDNEREKVPTRAGAYQSQVRLRELDCDTLATYQNWRDRASRAARAALRKKEFLLWISGNHLGVLPVLDELDRKTLVIQFDAHLDIYNLTDCQTELSHGNYL